MMVALFSSSCEDELDVSAPYQEQYVVYGLLDISEARHTLRIQKLYQNNNLSAATVAQRPDSIYPPDNIEVLVIESNPNNLQSLDTLRFVRDTLNSKDEGLFASQPHVLYRSERDKLLNSAFDYELLIRNPAVNYQIRSNTRLVGKPRFGTFPREGFGFEFTDQEDVSQSIYKIEFTPGPNARSFGISLRFFYEERMDGGPWTPKTLDLSITGAETQFIRGGNLIERFYDGGSLFRRLGNRLEAADNIQRRLIDSAVFVVANAEEELENYIRLSQVSGGPVESAPQYTNVENGLGVFSSRSQSSRWVRFNQNSKDTLRFGRFTEDLNFQLP